MSVTTMSLFPTFRLFVFSRCEIAWRDGFVGIRIHGQQEGFHRADVGGFFLDDFEADQTTIYKDGVVDEVLDGSPSCPIS